MSERSVDSVLLEVDYWRSVIDAAGALEPLFPQAADELVKSISFAFSLVPYVRTAAGAELLELSVKSAGAAMKKIRAMQEQTAALGRLIDGRIIALYAEVGLTMDAPE